MERKYKINDKIRMVGDMRNETNCLFNLQQDNGGSLTVRSFKRCESPCTDTENECCDGYSYRVDGDENLLQENVGWCAFFKSTELAKGIYLPKPKKPRLKTWNSKLEIE